MEEIEEKTFFADALIETARISAKPLVIHSENNFAALLQTHSRDAALVFLGFEIPGLPEAVEFQKSLTSTLSSLPTTLLVHSTGEVNLES